MANLNFDTDARQLQADRLRRTLSKAGCYPTLAGIEAAQDECDLTLDTLAETMPDLAPADQFAVMVVALRLANTSSDGDWRKPAYKGNVDSYPARWWWDTLRISVGYTFYAAGGWMRAVRRKGAAQ